MPSRRLSSDRLSVLHNNLTVKTDPLAVSLLYISNKHLLAFDKSQESAAGNGIIVSDPFTRCTMCHATTVTGEVTIVSVYSPSLHAIRNRIGLSTQFAKSNHEHNNFGKTYYATAI